MPCAQRAPRLAASLERLDLGAQPVELFLPELQIDLGEFEAEADACRSQPVQSWSSAFLRFVRGQRIGSACKLPRLYGDNVRGCG